MPKVHELKILPPHFKAVKDGRKKFEIRKDDRSFKVGDELLLREYDSKKEEYTGQVCHVKILYVLRDYPEVSDKFVILSIEKA